MKLKPMKVKSFKASTLLNLYRFAMTCKKGGTDYELPPFLRMYVSSRLSQTIQYYNINKRLNKVPG